VLREEWGEREEGFSEYEGKKKGGWRGGVCHPAGQRKDGAEGTRFEEML